MQRPMIAIDQSRAAIEHARAGEIERAQPYLAAAKDAGLTMTYALSDDWAVVRVYDPRLPAVIHFSGGSDLDDYCRRALMQARAALTPAGEDPCACEWHDEAGQRRSDGACPVHDVGG